MIIPDEKSMHPPPYYLPPPPSFEESQLEAHRELQRISADGNSLAKPTLATLPAHLLLHIVYSTFPQRDGRYEGEGKVERQRRNLYWLETSLRLVNKTFFVACMHILRSTYVPAYDSLIKPPYTSDPFSSALLTAESGPIRRELATLDLFIALLASEEVLLDATELHLPREEAYKDLFDMVQPRSRLEDLIFEEGVKLGVIYAGVPPIEVVDESEPPEATPVGPSNLAVPSQYDASSCPQPSPSPTKTSFTSYISMAKSKILRKPHRLTNSTPPSPSPTASSFAITDMSPKDTITPFPLERPTSPNGNSKARRIKPLPFEALSVSFSPRKVILVYTPANSSSNGAYGGSAFGALSVSVTGPTSAGGMKAKKVLAEVARAKDEELEVSAKKLVEELQEVLASG